MTSMSSTVATHGNRRPALAGDVVVETSISIPNEWPKYSTILMFSLDEPREYCYCLRIMVLNVIEIVLAVLLIAGILVQARGSGLGAAFGGDSNVYRTRRGIEKRLHMTTVVVAVAFFGVALANALV